MGGRKERRRKNGKKGMEECGNIYRCIFNVTTDISGLCGNGKAEHKWKLC